VLLKELPETLRLSAASSLCILDDADNCLSCFHPTGQSRGISEDHTEKHGKTWTR